MNQDAATRPDEKKEKRKTPPFHKPNPKGQATQKRFSELKRGHPPSSDLSFFTWRQLVQSKTSALILGRSSRPVRPMADWNHELGDWPRGALKLWIQQYRGARQICTPNLGIG